MKTVILILISTSLSFGQMSEKKQEAWTKIGVGLYVHALSGIFITKDFKNKNTLLPFASINVFSLQLDLMGVFQLVKIRREEKRLKRLK